jgi:hypothetical protein
MTPRFKSTHNLFVYLSLIMMHVPYHFQKCTLLKCYITTQNRTGKGCYPSNPLVWPHHHQPPPPSLPYMRKVHHPLPWVTPSTLVTTFNPPLTHPGTHPPRHPPTHSTHTTNYPPTPQPSSPKQTQPNLMPPPHPNPTHPPTRST